MIVPPTPPATESTLTRAPSGMIGASPVRICSRFGAASSAAPTIVTNIIATKAAQIFSMSSYLPNHTRASPMSPDRMPHHVTDSAGKSEASGRPVPAIAAEP